MRWYNQLLKQLIRFGLNSLEKNFNEMPDGLYRRAFLFQILKLYLFTMQNKNYDNPISSTACDDRTNHRLYGATN